MYRTGAVVVLVLVLLAAAASAAGVTIRRGTVTPTRNGWVSTDQRSAGDELVPPPLIPLSSILSLLDAQLSSLKRAN
jgi:hypothetical protein